MKVYKTQTEELQADTAKSATTVGHFITYIAQKLIDQEDKKTDKDKGILTNTISVVDLINAYKSLYPQIRKYTLILREIVAFTKVDHQIDLTSGRLQVQLVFFNLNFNQLINLY